MDPQAANCMVGMGQLGLYGGCSLPHPPANAEEHARARIKELDREIPRLTQQLAEMAIEKKRIEKMLAALDTP